MQRSGSVPDNMKKCQVEIRTMEKHSLNNHADCVMSSETHYQCDHPCRKMLKLIYGEILGAVEDEFSYYFLHRPTPMINCSC